MATRQSARVDFRWLVMQALRLVVTMPRPVTRAGHDRPRARINRRATTMPDDVALRGVNRPHRPGQELESAAFGAATVGHRADARAWRPTTVGRSRARLRRSVPTNGQGGMGLRTASGASRRGRLVAKEGGV